MRIVTSAAVPLLHGTMFEFLCLDVLSQFSMTAETKFRGWDREEFRVIRGMRIMALVAAAVSYRRMWIIHGS